MNWRTHAMTVIAVAFLNATSDSIVAQDAEASPDGIAGKGFAVVELFTSQGCSSCPPADALLSEVASLGAKNALPVLCLSFHVDYWNRLGWMDPYSDSRYSDRQRSYAAAAGSSRIYTPQMVVNGSTEFVGSHREKARAAIGKALQQPSTVQIELNLKPSENQSSVVVRYSVAGLTNDHVLNFALAHSPQPNRVPRGENAGRSLSHVNVVRSFVTVSANKQSGTVELEIPDGIGAESAGVFAYVQHVKTKAIVGATVRSDGLNLTGR